MNEEAFCITNPSRKQYRFLFRVSLDDETLAIGQKFVDEWLLEHGKTIKRQKIVDMPIQGMFEIKTWLN